MNTKHNLKSEDDNSQIWWDNKSEDDKILLMMKFGFSEPFYPNTVTKESIRRMFNLDK